MSTLACMEDWVMSTLACMEDWVISTLVCMQDWVMSTLACMEDWVISTLVCMEDWVMSTLACMEELQCIGITCANLAADDCDVPRCQCCHTSTLSLMLPCLRPSTLGNRTPSARLHCGSSRRISRSMSWQ